MQYRVLTEGHAPLLLSRDELLALMRYLKSVIPEGAFECKFDAKPVEENDSEVRDVVISGKP